jgi:hypothetical protein
MDQKKKNMLLIGAAVLLLGGALLMGFRNMIFGEGSNLPSAELQAAIDESAKVADPPPAEPQKSPFSKTPKPVGQ